MVNVWWRHFVINLGIQKAVVWLYSFVRIMGYNAQQ